MGEQLEKEGQIDIRQAFLTLLQRWPVIVAATVVCGLAAYVWSNWFMTPMYSTNVKFYVNNQKGVSDSIKVQSADVATSSTLVHGYVAMIKTDRVLEEVAMNSGLGYSAAQIGSMLDASGVENTSIFVVTVKNNNPAHAQTIANVVADVAPSIIQDIVKGSSVEIIDRAKLPVRPMSPDVKKITVMGFLAGFLISVIAVLLIENLDGRVRSEEELISKFDLPVLGAVPKMSDKLSSAKGYYASGRNGGQDK